jgi:hypothetical protein
MWKRKNTSSWSSTCNFYSKKGFIQKQYLTITKKRILIHSRFGMKFEKHACRAEDTNSVHTSPVSKMHKLTLFSCPHSCPCCLLQRRTLYSRTKWLLKTNLKTISWKCNHSPIFCYQLSLWNNQIRAQEMELLQSKTNVAAALNKVKIVFRAKI